MTEYHVKRCGISWFDPDDIGDTELIQLADGCKMFRAVGWAATLGLTLLEIGRVIEVLPDGTAWVELSKEPPKELWASVVPHSVTWHPACYSRPSTANPPTLPSATHGFYLKNPQIVSGPANWGMISPEMTQMLLEDIVGVTAHARDANGSLRCSRCNAPYPYAEPPASGPFVCYGCKVVM